MTSQSLMEAHLVTAISGIDREVMAQWIKWLLATQQARVRLPPQTLLDRKQRDPTEAFPKYPWTYFSLE